MKYSLLTAVIITMALTSCGDPKPAQYPPRQYDREGLLSDKDLAAAKEQASKKAEKVYPADDPVVPHAKSDKELSTEKRCGS